jgi:hypothetical protein
MPLLRIHFRTCDRDVTSSRGLTLNQRITNIIQLSYIKTEAQGVPSRDVFFYKILKEFKCGVLPTDFILHASNRKAQYVKSRNRNKHVKIVI